MEEYLKQMKSEVDEIESNIGWNHLYQMIRAQSMTYENYCSEAKLPTNKLLNRYRDVSPFDHTRVQLTKGSCNYINASHVKVDKAGRSYILTQGPLPQTAGHFWLMVWEQKSRAILMLNKVIEKNQIKCHQYWPIGSQEGGDDVMEFSDVGIKVRLLHQRDSPHFIVRNFSVEDTSTNTSREVLQFHYTTWPDFGVPSSPRAFLHFLQVVRDSGALEATVGPPVVHCSAGIGRSGTFCLVDSCLLMMEKGSRVNARELLLEMRKFRMGLIQTADQLKFSYLAIVEGIRQLAEGNNQFMSDEENGGINHDHEEDKPRPPPRVGSLPPKTLSNEDIIKRDQYLRLIEAANLTSIPSRPLPPSPPSDGDERTDSSDSDSDSDELIDEGDDTKSESLSEELHESVDSYSNLIRTAPDPDVSTTTTSNGTSKSNGVELSNNKTTNVASEPAPSNEESSDLRNRRIKNEALREKLKEMKAHQKESEAMRGLYRSLPGKYLFYFLACGIIGACSIYYYNKSS